MQADTALQLPLLAALNGDRDHPAAPRTPRQLAAEARAAVAAGALSVHIHPYDDNGVMTLEAEPCAQAIRAVRAACPGVPISLSTSAEIEPDPDRRHALVAGWTEGPELVTANQGEAGIVELCALLWERGIGIEAGLLALDDATAFVAANLAPRCVRVLLEPLDADPDTAVAHAMAMEQVLDAGSVSIQRIYHGEGMASWAVNRYGIGRGCGIRTGLEDCPVLPDGRTAAGNGELVAAAAALLGLSDFGAGSRPRGTPRSAG
ncbi:MAG: 3-keto-5-aminohexanoate cleavage protein [Chloroflexota bacterium]|nr:3-keto-5-aminohexanoate cleavage protein [Chloroflexota bacterium]